jgi:hypothetical protein
MIDSFNGTSSMVSELLHTTEQLPSHEFDTFYSNVVTMNARRKAPSLSHEESELLLKINKVFSPKKMERYFFLQDKRRAETIEPTEQKELSQLIRQLEQYDAQRIQWIGQLSIIRKMPLSDLMKQMGLFPSHHGK